MMIPDRKQLAKLEISTLGSFQVRQGDLALSDNSSRSNKLWELFKFLLTNRGKRLPPGDILDTLWPDQEYDDPRRALRTLVYRLRQILSAGPAAGASDCSIVFSHGCYSLELASDCRVDLDEFERICLEAQKTARDDPAGAIALYRRAVDLYRGEYLPECSYSEWVMPVRNYYRHLYLRAVLELTGLLKDAGQHAELIMVCEKAFLVELFEEELHVRFLEALLEKGRIKQARAHYDYITTALYRVMGVKPGAGLRNIARLIRMEKDGVELDLSAIQQSLRDRQEAAGAFLCDPDIFRFLYRLEARRGERSGQAVLLGLLTVTRPDYGLPHQGELKDVMDLLGGLLADHLRKGDVISRWNEAQYLLLLPGLSYKQGDRVLARIGRGFKDMQGKGRVALRTSLEPVLPPHV